MPPGPPAMPAMPPPTPPGPRACHRALRCRLCRHQRRQARRACHPSSCGSNAARPSGMPPGPPAMPAMPPPAARPSGHATGPSTWHARCHRRLARPGAAGGRRGGARRVMSEIAGGVQLKAAPPRAPAAPAHSAAAATRWPLSRGAGRQNLKYAAELAAKDAAEGGWLRLRGPQPAAGGHHAMHHARCTMRCIMPFTIPVHHAMHCCAGEAGRTASQGGGRDAARAPRPRRPHQPHQPHQPRRPRRAARCSATCRTATRPPSALRRVWEAWRRTAGLLCEQQTSETTWTCRPSCRSTAPRSPLGAAAA